MPAPFKYPLKIIQGATFDDIVFWKTGATLATSTPVNLTVCTARAQVRESVESDTVLLELTTDNGHIELGGPDGSIRLLISATDTAALNWTSGVYDLEVEFPNGYVVRLLHGSVSVSPEVTR